MSKLKGIELESCLRENESSRNEIEHLIKMLFATRSRPFVSIFSTFGVFARRTSLVGGVVFVKLL